MENNLENKARFFGCNIGLTICYPDTDPNGKITKAKLTSVGFDEIQTTYFKRKKSPHGGYTVGDILSFNPKNAYHDSNGVKAYLELTPLSEISDEDAEHIAKYRYKSSKMLSSQIGKGIIDDYLNRVHENANFNIEQYEIDYLRSKGYALPYMDLSVEDLISYGWIKLRVNGKQR